MALNTDNASPEKHYEQFCGEHNGEIANFETATATLENPSQWEKVYRRKCTNISRIARTALPALVGAALTGPAFLLAAPAIGGAIGVALGLKGAAATSAGMALLGGGAVAAGGFGMAGGLAVITCVGAGVGGISGAWIGNKYLSDIEGFKIHQMNNPETESAKQCAVITVNGFLSQDDDALAFDWQPAVEKHYPGHAWYHVDWEASNLQKLGSFCRDHTTWQVAKEAVTQAALSATKKAAASLSGVALVAHAISLAGNPWHVAWMKAEMTGVVLADILKRCENMRFVLMGHSLGARVIYHALSTLSTTGKQIIEEVHLLGGAVDNDDASWRKARKAVRGNIYNYYSLNDDILYYLYSCGDIFLQFSDRARPHRGTRDRKRRCIQYRQWSYEIQGTRG